MPWAEQAIFTSIRGTRLDGYQLAVTSSGISTETAKELTQWGPAHDSLYEPIIAQPSVAWFRLTSGEYCLAVTQPTSGEYSGRQGARIYTHFLLVPEALATRLLNPAWQIFRALNLAGRFLVRDPLPQRLERCPISVTQQLPARQSSAGVVELATALGDRLGANDPDAAVAIPCDSEANAHFEALWWALPEPLRRTTSFCTGLRYTLRRPFRVQAVPNDGALVRKLGREPGVRVLEFSLQAASAG